VRIGVDIRALRADWGRGIGHYTYSLLDEMVTTRSDDRWMLLQTVPEFRLPKRWELPNVELVETRQPHKVVNATVALTGRPRFDRLLGDLDVFFAPNVAYIGLSADVPLVITVHDVSFVSHAGLLTPRERVWHRLARVDGLIARAREVITDSHESARHLRREYPSVGDRLTVIHLGIDAQYRPASAAEIAAVRERYDLPPRYFLFLGTVEPRKNIGGILAGFRAAREAGLESELVLAGTVSPRLAATVGSAGGVRSIGYVDEDEKPALYSGAVGLVFVSVLEGFGFPPLEALACGTPSVVSDLAIFDETVGDAAMRVAPDRPRALAEALMELERDPDLGRELVAKGARRLPAFDWRETAAATYGVLRRAAGQR
jgi:glycosyltransferase involved in cell wall biosynthesis